MRGADSGMAHVSGWVGVALAGDSVLMSVISSSNEPAWARGARR
jgi:hypothetical protein